MRIEVRMKKMRMKKMMRMMRTQKSTGCTDGRKPLY